MTIIFSWKCQEEKCLEFAYFPVSQTTVISILNCIISQNTYPPFQATADIFQGMALKSDMWHIRHNTCIHEEQMACKRQGAVRVITNTGNTRKCAD